MIWRRTKPSTTEVDKPKGFDDFELRLGDLMRGERATLGKSLLDVQRELKIKATYIAAIENADVSAFETQGFVAGYVRSYARYLGMDPDWAFKRFCAEANFEVAHGMSAAATPATIAARRSRPLPETRDPFADPNASFVPRSESFLSRVEPGAVGSLVVLAALIGAIGYGGWSVLQEVQRVQLAPVDQAPAVVAEIDPLGNVAGTAPLVRSAPEPVLTADATDAAAPGTDVMDRLYRPQAEALEVPVLTSRDGPIAAIDPRQTGALAAVAPAAASALPDDAAMAQAAVPEVQVLADAKPGVEVMAVRPSWVRVSSADGTVLFEKILDAGERYLVPQLEQAAQLRSGNAGSVYFVVNGQAFGPAGDGPSVVKGVELSTEALTSVYQVADLTADPDLAQAVAVASAAPAVDPALVAPAPGQ
jgi:cytoskeletal protein RodZ